MRAIGAARAGAQDDLYRRLAPLLSTELLELLDALVVTDPTLGVAPLVWLGDGATSPSPESIKAQLTKLARVRTLGADRLDLAVVPPERLRQLAVLARRSTPKSIRLMAPERRYPMLLAALAQTHTDLLDEIVGMFDQALATTESRARARLTERQLAVARADLDRLVLLDEILTVVLDDALDDLAVGSQLRNIDRQRLAGATRSDHECLPADGGHLELMEARFAHVRSFAPQVLAALTFAPSTEPSQIHAAVTLLQALNTDGRRQVPDEAPSGSSPPGGPRTWPPPGPQATRKGSSTTGSSASSSPSGERSDPANSGSRAPAATPTRPRTSSRPRSGRPVAARFSNSPVSRSASPNGSTTSMTRSTTTSTTSTVSSPPRTARSASTTTAGFTSAHSPPSPSTRPSSPKAPRSRPGSPRCPSPS